MKADRPSVTPAGKVAPAPAKGEPSLSPSAAPFSPSISAPDPGRPLTEEEQIESAKYLPRDLPPRLFEEERFLFPETYGTNRVRLMVKDPEWLFAHWDVNPDTFAALRRDLGERTAALSRLTLRVTDTANGGTSVILLPYGARTWYVRADRRRRSYQAELGVTLPSGEFRRLAVSNTVVTPRVGASRKRASRVVRYEKGRDLSREPAPALDAEDNHGAPPAGPWRPGAPHDGGEQVYVPGTDDAGHGPSGETGGASDIYRR